MTKRRKKRRINKRNLAIFLCSIVTLVSLIVYVGYHAYLWILPVFNGNIEDISKKEIVIGSVMLDAGHGSFDSGSVSIDNIMEKDITLDIVKMTGAILEENNVEVVYTRKDDSIPWATNEVEDLNGRVEMSNNSDVDLFVSVHMNAMEFNDGLRGMEVWSSSSDEISTRLAERIVHNLANLNYTINRGVKDEERFPLVVISKNNKPSVLVEAGFITDENDMNFINTQSGKEKIAKEIADGILETLQEIKN